MTLAEDDDGDLFAIVDAARNETLLQKLALNQVKYQSLFQGSKVEEQYFAVSPFLVECKEGTELLRWLTTDVWGSSCGVFFTSSDSYINLFTHFRRFLQVGTDDGKKLYFRFFDPRVLRVYLPTCTAEELELFYGAVRRFLVESEGAGSVLSYSRTDTGAGRATADIGPTDSLGRLIVRKPQIAAFSAAATESFENRMVARLYRSYHKECEALGESGVREVIRYGIDRAGKYEIRSEKGVAQYVYLMFEFGRDFDGDPAHPWAAQILNDPGIPDTATRIRQLRAAADGHRAVAKGMASERGD